MKTFSEILLAMCIFLLASHADTSYQKTEVEEKFANEINYLRKAYKWFAFIDAREDNIKVEWLKRPPEDTVKFLEKIIPIEVEISRKQKTKRFIFCVASNGFATCSYQVRSDSIVVNNKSLKLHIIKEYLSEEETVPNN